MDNETIEEIEEDNRTLLRCSHCKYEWKSRGKMLWITCPKCQKKFEKKG